MASTSSTSPRTARPTWFTRPPKKTTSFDISTFQKTNTSPTSGATPSGLSRYACHRPTTPSSRVPWTRALGCGIFGKSTIVKRLNGLFINTCFCRSNYCQGFMQLAGRPVAAFDPEGLIFAAGINSESVKLYDLRSFDKGPFSSFKFSSKPYNHIGEYFPFSDINI